MKDNTYTNSAKKTTPPHRSRNTCGVFAVDRGVFDHPVFADEAFSEREAWLYLVSEAAWKPHRRRVGKFICDLQRGQLAASIRFLADRWRWDRSKVHRFLLRLKREGMIETAYETGLNVISICNYNTYQRVSLPTETATETASRQHRDKLEYKEAKEAKKESSLRSESPDGLLAGKIFDEQFWPSYPPRTNNPKKPAREKFIKLVVNDKIDPQVILTGLGAYSASRKGEDQTYTKHANVWLNQHCWQDNHTKPDPYHDPNKSSGRPAIEGANQLRAAIEAGYELPPRPEI